MPLYLDLSGRKVVIFGGGQVGERKARLFSRYSRVEVASKDFTPGLLELERVGKVELKRTDLSEASEDLIEGAFIVVPATDDRQLNRSLEEVAREKGVLVNKVDGVGEVVVPSVIRRGPVTVAISTLGQSPALSKYIRLKLEEGELGKSYPEMARLLGVIRVELKRTVPQQSERKKILWEIISDDEVWKLLEESYEKAYKRAGEHVKSDERDSLDAGDPSDGMHRRD